MQVLLQPLPQPLARMWAATGELRWRSTAVGTAGLRAPEVFAGNVPKLSQHRGSAAQELAMAVPRAQGDKDPRIWDMQTLEGPSMDWQSDVWSRPPLSHTMLVQDPPGFWVHWLQLEHKPHGPEG